MSNKIQVSNLPAHINNNQFYELFCRVVGIKNAQLVIQPQTQRKVGILEFQTIEYAATAKSIFENRSPLPQENLKFDFIFDNLGQEMMNASNLPQMAPQRPSNLGYPQPYFQEAQRYPPMQPTPQAVPQGVQIPPKMPQYPQQYHQYPPSQPQMPEAPKYNYHAYQNPAYYQQDS